MAMLSNLDLIRRVPLFSLLTNDQAQGIADSVVKRRFRRGEIVVEHGKKSNALYILLTGRARVLTADSRGREVILAVLQSGDYVGEMSLIDNEPHSATVRAEGYDIGSSSCHSRASSRKLELSYAIMAGLGTACARPTADRIARVARVYCRVALRARCPKWTASSRSPHQGVASGPRNVVGASREMVTVMTDSKARMVQPGERGSSSRSSPPTEFRRRSDSRPWIASRIAGARVLRHRAAACVPPQFLHDISPRFPARRRRRHDGRDGHVLSA